MALNVNQRLVAKIMVINSWNVWQRNFIDCGKLAVEIVMIKLVTSISPLWPFMT